MGGVFHRSSTPDQGSNFGTLLERFEEGGYVHGRAIPKKVLDADDDPQTDTLAVRVKKTAPEAALRYFTHKEVRCTLVSFEIEAVIDDPGIEGDHLFDSQGIIMG